MPSHDLSPVSQQQQDQAYAKVMQLSMGYMPPAAMYAVAKLRIPDALASGPRPIAELAAEMGVNEDALYRVMRMLASLGIFNEVGLRYFTLTPAAQLLRSGVSGSLRDWVMFGANPFHLRVYPDMMHSLKTGAPAVEKTTGMSCFDYFGADREVAAEFNAAMTGISSMLLPAILEAYDFTGIGTLVNVAGGHGFLLCSILGKYPNMLGVLFEVGHVIEGAKPKIEHLGLAGRCRTEAGDFFREIPAGGDAYLMQHIVHDWDDERGIQILKNVRRAMDGAARGKLLLLEDVIEPGNEPGPVKNLDIEMLLLPGGRERTVEEFRQLLAASGFKLERVIPTRAPVRVIEGVAV